MKEIKKLFKSYRVKNSLRPVVVAAAAAYELVQKLDVIPGIPG